MVQVLKNCWAWAGSRAPSASRIASRATSASTAPTWGATSISTPTSTASSRSAADLQRELPAAEPLMSRLRPARPGCGNERVSRGRRQRSRAAPDPAMPGNGRCTVDKVAQHLGVSRATLHRQLSAEGGTFSSILESVRRDVAQRLRSESDRSLDDVAAMLGFSSASAFAHWHRAGFDASSVRSRRAASRAVRDDRSISATNNQSVARRPASFAPEPRRHDEQTGLRHPAACLAALAVALCASAARLARQAAEDRGARAGRRPIDVDRRVYADSWPRSWPAGGGRQPRRRLAARSGCRRCWPRRPMATPSW